MSTPFANSLKRSRPLLSSSSHNVTSSDPQDSHTRSPCADLCMKSPTRKKRKDLNLENFTPERESARSSRGSSRRSTTPDVVRYEPPSEKFTPPRNVVLETSSAKSSQTRLSTPAGLARITAERKVVVKRERSMSPFPLPPIDLTKPPPPPSPTDDPLLLMESPFIDRNLPKGLIDVEDNIFDDSTSNAMAFDPNQSVGTDIFHSDDDEVEMKEVGEAEGEFTGRFKYYKTPVKDDPPSAATKQRQDSWGRPISPHPRKMDQPWGDSDDDDDEDDSKSLAPSPDDSFVASLSEPFDTGEIDEDMSVKSNKGPGLTSSDDEFVSGVVEVSSNDPRAAARAAAILKLHHSYIIDGIGDQRPRYPSPSFSRHGSVLSETSQCTDQYISPSVSYAALPDVNDNYLSGGKEWTKACWKILDTCFTEERFAVAESMGKFNTMADVDDISYESVVERFITQCNDSSWDREMLSRRVQVLSKRQRSGRGATRPMQPYVRSTTSVPSMLLAPRYAHLRNERRSAKTPGAKSSSIVQGKLSDASDRSRVGGSTIPFPVPRTPEPEPRSAREPPLSGTKIVLSYLGSLFGRSSPFKSRSNPAVKPLSSLPAPPEMRQLRGPVSTPAKIMIPQGMIPKDMVQLNEISPVSAKEFEKLRAPKDLVHLNHVEPPPSVRARASSNPLLRDRKNSGGSVKDLVKCFEEAAKKTGNEVGITAGRSLRKTASVSNLNMQSRWNS